jgi:hypothetical protein
MPAPSALARGYAPGALNVARAIGALAQVDRLAAASLRHAPDGEIAELRGQVNDTITVASLDLASTVAHISCEEGRAGQIASDLRAAEQTQARNLTVYSLVFSAAAAVAGGLLAKNPIPAGVVGVSGGLASAGFGFGTLAVHRSTPFHHARNILGEVWMGTAHPSFPEAVWAYLTRPEFSRTGDRTLRDYLLATWRESGCLGDDPAHLSETRIALYFGEGGLYDASALDDRANMLSDLREIVSLLNHGLRHLATEAAQRGGP